MVSLTRTEDSLSAAAINEWSWVSFFILLKAAIIAMGTRQTKRKYISAYLCINSTIDYYKMLGQNQNPQNIKKIYRESKEQLGTIWGEKSYFHSSSIYKDTRVGKWADKCKNLVPFDNYLHCTWARMSNFYILLTLQDIQIYYIQLDC